MREGNDLLEKLKFPIELHKIFEIFFAPYADTLL
jgi:hypothetical protein